jgi:hypothetical protein
VEKTREYHLLCRISVEEDTETKEYNKQKEVLSTSTDSTVPSKTGGRDSTGSNTG